MEHLLLQTLFPLKEPKGKEKEVVVVVAVVGEWHGHDMGSFKITAEDLENMRANAEAQKTDVVIDYEHQTLYGGQAPAAGWISKLEVKDNELLGTVTWTSKATKHIKEGEYKYIDNYQRYVKFLTFFTPTGKKIADFLLQKQHFLLTLFFFFNPPKDA